MFSVVSVNHSVQSGERDIHVTMINDALDLTVRLPPPAPLPQTSNMGPPLPGPSPVPFPVTSSSHH